MKREVGGFSLYELIVVLAIIGIALGLALPAMYQLVMRRNNESTFLQLKAIIKYAQAEALRRGFSVNICSAAFNTVNGVNATLNGCAALASGWDEGVLVYNDLNSNSDFNAGERVRAYRFDTEVAITAANSNGAAIRSFIIGSNGQITTTGTPFRFTFTQSKFGTTFTRVVCVNSYGNVCLKNDGDNGACVASGDSTCN